MPTKQSLKNIRYRERKERMVMAMGGTCQLCGFDGPDCCYDFHHRDPMSKLYTIGECMTSLSDDRFETDAVHEIETKCILLCSNCHRKVHWDHGC